MINRRSLLLAGLALPTAARAQCVTDTPAVDACRGGVRRIIPGPPALDLSFMTPGTLDPRITLTRASTATYFDATGMLQTAAINTPRWDYDPVTHAVNGLLIEEARTNVLFPSQTINSWPTKTGATIVDNSTTSPDGTVNASMITVGAAQNDSLSTAVASVPSASAMALSLFLKQGNFNWLHFYLTDSGAANGVQTWFNMTTGAFSNTTLVGSATKPVTSVVQLSNGWWRATLGVTMPVGSVTALPIVRTSGGPGDGGRFDNGTYYLWGGQIEAGTSVTTSYIPTAGTSATRAADFAFMPTDSWFNPAAGSLAGEFIVGQSPNSSTSVRDVCALTDSSTANRLILRGLIANAGTAQFATSIASAHTTSPSLGSVTANVPTKLAAAWNGTSGIGSLNGAATLSYSVGMPGSINRLTFGNDTPTVGAYLNGWLRRAQYWPRALSAAELQAVTGG